MADSKESGGGFFRKVVRFVANPATDWNDLGAARGDDPNDAERSELKAMVERKRRNDFVRKREFDMLRRLRREGLSPEQLAALGGSSKMSDSEVRASEPSIVRADGGVKAKIDEIEQQMVGDGASGIPRGSEIVRPTPRRPLAPAAGPALDAGPPSLPSLGPVTDFSNAPTEPAVALSSAMAPTEPMPLDTPRGIDAPMAAIAIPTLESLGMLEGVPPLGADTAPMTDLPPLEMDLGGLPMVSGGAMALSAATPPPLPAGAVEVNEIIHDPDLDEAVMAFANADFDSCQQSLERLLRQGGPRHGHAETWHVLFDLYRATGQLERFEPLAMDYAALFGRSAPQWFSLPQLLSEQVGERPAVPRAVSADGSWSCPETLDADAVQRLRAGTLQLPLPWGLDWSALRHVTLDAADALAVLLRQWAGQRLEMRWQDTDRLLQVLQAVSPTGVRDAAQAYWMARLEVLRLINRPDQFDETAIDYCVTYEVSPPSWAHAQCKVRTVTGAGGTPTQAPASLLSDGTSTSFPESRLEELTPIVNVELDGQLAGDISALLTRIDQRIGASTLIQVSCARLVRVDFIAAGDLLNWVLARRGEQRSVSFVDTHRLVALFFSAMGINEHARVQVQRQ
ncbi:MAG: hypothetical protein RIQ53_416 [Pseudomonadota bacterium]|jgi:hypothetical protein